MRSREENESSSLYLNEILDWIHGKESAQSEIPQSDYPNSEFRKKITEENTHAITRSGRQKLFYNKTQVQTRTEEAGSTAVWRLEEKRGTISNTEKRNYLYQWFLSDPPHWNDSLSASDMVCQVETASRSDHIPWEAQNGSCWMNPQKNSLPIGHS